MAAGARRILILAVVFTGAAGAAAVADAATLRVGRSERWSTIASALSAAHPGDTVRVEPGTYREHGLIVDKPLVLTGVDRPVIDPDNQGEIITVTASGVVIRGFFLKNVGTSFVEDRAAIRLKKVDGAVVEDNRFENAFFGIYAEHSANMVVRRNHLQGPGGREVTAGNGIHLWYCKRARIEDNEVHGHRDGIYFEFVEDSSIRGNFSSGNIRYGLHFMFSHGNEYIDNRFVENGAGVAVMYTERVKMHGNLFEHNWGTSSYGLLLKDIRDSEIRHNRFVANTVGLYAEGSNRLTVTENEFIDNGFAARIVANSIDNVFSTNNFIGNSFDVVTNSRQSFNTFDSNYWSEYDGYDLDKDGVGDVPHHPVRLFSLIVEKAPPGIVLMGSLFVTLIDTAERVMPVFTPETLVDRNPRMQVIVIDDDSDTSGASR
jgi:nitrous oxidase accessory protein